MTTAADAGTYPAAEFHYTRIFDPRIALNSPDLATARAGGDRPRNSPYHYDEEIILAVNAALAANRPLLVAGPAGVGKSALAANIADQMKWGYEAKVITGQTEGNDLLWRYDTVRRLRDAYFVIASERQRELVADAAPDAPDEAAASVADATPAAVGETGEATNREARDAQDGMPGSAAGAPHDPTNVLAYIERGVLWKAFARSQKHERVVVLIDEIDKADPDVPNSLLEVLGNGQFTFGETGEEIKVNDNASPFIVITTNDERELSRAFRRRCVTLTLRSPDADRLVKIAHSWNLDQGKGASLAPALAQEVAMLAARETPQGRLEPNAAEYLDALRVCLDLKVELGTSEWEAIKRFTLLKDLAPRRDVG